MGRQRQNAAVDGEMGNKWAGNAFIYLIIFVAIIAIFFAVFSTGDGSQETDLTNVIQMAQRGEVTSITVDGDRLLVEAGVPLTRYVTTKEPGTSIYDTLVASGVDPAARGIEIRVESRGGLGAMFGVLIQFLPLIFFGAI